MLARGITSMKQQTRRTQVTTLTVERPILGNPTAELRCRGSLFLVAHADLSGGLLPHAVAPPAGTGYRSPPITTPWAGF